MANFAKDSTDRVFKQLTDGSYERVLNPLDSQLAAWVLVNGEPAVNKELDAIR